VTIRQPSPVWPPCASRSTPSSTKWWWWPTTRPSRPTVWHCWTTCATCSCK